MKVPSDHWIKDAFYIGKTTKGEGKVYVVPHALGGIGNKEKKRITIINIIFSLFFLSKRITIIK